MTAQEIYDAVKKHLLAQNARSTGRYNGNDGCAYRGKNGLKCAVGVLFTDEEYTPKMEIVGGVWSLIESGLLPERFMSHQLLLRDLQRVHDSTSPFEWAAELDRVAKKHGLEP